MNKLTKAIINLIEESLKPNSKVTVSNTGIGLNLENKEIQKYMIKCLKRIKNG